MEIIKSFESVSGHKLNYKIGPRRSGDVVQAYADTSKSNTQLGWKAKLTLDDALRSAWKWQNTL